MGEEDYYSYIRKFFKRWARVYDITDLFISGVRDTVVEFTNAGNGSKILDVCAGTGKQTFAFAKRGYEVVGIDLSEAMLRVARQKNKYENARFAAGDGTNMPFEDNHFDVSCVSFALHDMPLTIREKVLKEMVRVTRSRGKVVIVDYGLPDNKLGRYLVYQVIRSYETKYYTEFIKSGLEDLLTGLQIEIDGQARTMLGTVRILREINRKNNPK
jgi:demethylmenaquinone methyltransferase/2-methoxy-6-polyprenyl-1,4-benzoquinol methylase